MIKKVLCLLFSLVLVMALAVTGVYAVDLTGYFVSGRSSSTVTAFDNGFTIIDSGSNQGYAKPATVVSSMSGTVNWSVNQYSAPVNYLWFSGNSYLTVNNVTDLINCTLTTENNGATYVYPETGATSGSFSFEVQYSIASQTPYFAVPSSYSNISVTFDFDSLTIDGVDVITNVVGETVDFSLSPGYALVIDGPCEVLERSYYINNSWDFTKNGNMRVNGAFENDLSATYIRDGYSPDLAYTRDDLIQWEALNPNILGAASNYEAYTNSLVQITQGETFVIGYPQLYGYGSTNSRLLYTNSVDLIGSVYINYSQRPSFRYVALESLSEFTNSGDFYTYSVFRPAVADVSGDITEGSGGVTVNPSSPLPSGGGNTGQPPVDEDGSLLGTISRFVNDIKRLLSSAVEAINTLVNDGSSFMQSIGAMFTWLPAPLTSLIIAGFTVLLVVGVLKVLWR